MDSSVYTISSFPFGGHLKEDNRWVQLRNMIDWQIIDEEYSRHFRNKAAGQEAYPSSVAFGSLYIQRRLGLTDRELIDQISENPYMQYFIGYKEFRDEKPFDASLLVTFRKRLPEDVMNRIVSLSQPWIRPIVRGKAKAPTEFGAKLSVSVVGGYTFIDKLSFNAYNEGEASEFEQVVEKYRKRFGHYPERILADKIYRSKSNRAFCKEHGIHLSGPRLGRRGKDHSEELLQELKEIGERNEVEGKFGNGKRKLGLSRIMAKLAETTGAMIGMDIFILNMEKLMRQEASLVYSFFEVVFSFALSIRKQHKNNVISGAWTAV